MALFADTFAVVCFGITAIELYIGAIRIFDTHGLFYTFEGLFVTDRFGVGTICTIGTFHLFAGERCRITYRANFLTVLVFRASDATSCFGVAVGFPCGCFAAIVVGTRSDTTTTAITSDAVTRAI